jgi:hypothetical protein
VGVYGGPDVSESGLVLALDGANSKSFRGQSIDNMYYISNGGSANSSIWHMPMGGTATGTYTTSHSYGTWNGNTIFEVTVSAGTIPGGYESFRDCISSSWNATYGNTRRLTAKVRMIKGTIANLGVHNGGGTGGGTYTTFNEYLVPKDVNIRDEWYLLDTDVSGSYPFGQCVGIGILSADIKFLVTEMMVHNTSNSVRFTPTTRGTTVATGGGWADLSGRGNNGELVNGVIESADNLGALVFDGTNDRVELGFSSTLDISASITIEGFIYPTAYKTTGGYGGMLITKVASYYSELDYSGKIRAYYYGLNSPGYHTSNSTVPLNTWTHYAVVRDSDSSSIVFYINGSLDRTITSITGSITVQQTYPVTLGSYNGSGYEYTGRIASGKIYNRALTAAEVQQNFNASRGRFGI